MAFIHGKLTVVKVNAKDLSAYTNKSDFKLSGDKHDITTYGANSHAYQSGLKDATFQLEGVYDSVAASSPRGALESLIGGAAVACIRQPEGAGTGKAQDSFQGIVVSYTETNPVNDMVKWSAEIQVTGDVNSAAQP